MSNGTIEKPSPLEHTLFSFVLAELGEDATTEVRQGLEPILKILDEDGAIARQIRLYMDIKRLHEERIFKEVFLRLKERMEKDEAFHQLIASHVRER